MTTTTDRRLARVALAPLTWALVIGGCEKRDDDKKDDGNMPSTAWLVGEHAAMFRLDELGEIATYPLRISADLTAIACKGTATAWVAGDAGTLLHTGDAGAHWEAVVAGEVTADFTALAAAQAQPEGQETIIVVGTAGTALRSDDAGAHFVALPGAPGVDFTGVALDAHGGSALLTALDGSIWRSLQGGPLTQVFATPDAALHGVSASHDGERAVAVGDAGLVLTSADAGTTWTSLTVPTTRDLLAVRMAGDGDQSVAVGEAGVVVHLDDAGATAQELLDAELSLHAVHLRSDGSGQAVGDEGHVFSTADFGSRWAAHSLDVKGTLRGVDDFHAGGHF